MSKAVLRIKNFKRKKRGGCREKEELSYDKSHSLSLIDITTTNAHAAIVDLTTFSCSEGNDNAKFTQDVTQKLIEKQRPS